mmetsp:Transcript_17480/g.31556  ORF Transcript_17480/g.31556 Transcript_17480/m.31556 type:complete len:157 (-) Transcript_17480:35-505(-)
MESTGHSVPSQPPHPVRSQPNGIAWTVTMEVPRRRRRVEVDEFMADVPVAPPEEDVLAPDFEGGELHELAAAELLPREWSPCLCSNGECPICLMEFQASTLPTSGGTEAEATASSVVVLPCRHGFHVTCIRQWLQRRFHCPVCRGGCHTSLQTASS